MKLVIFLTLVAPVIAVSSLFLACGASGDATDGTTPNDGGGAETAPPPPPHDSGAAKPKDANTCTASCTSNADCQSTCAAPSAGTSCCHISTGTCYTYNANTCPIDVVDSGGVD